MEEREIGFQKHDRGALKRVRTGSEMAINRALVGTYIGEWIGLEASTNSIRHKRRRPHSGFIDSNDSLNLGRHGGRMNSLLNLIFSKQVP